MVSPLTFHGREVCESKAVGHVCPTRTKFFKNPPNPPFSKGEDLGQRGRYKVGYWPWAREKPTLPSKVYRFSVLITSRPRFSN
jgi:hypothetical protein